MMTVKNGAVIRALSRRSLRANGLRNLIATAAIALTAMMFTSVFTIGAGMLDAQQQQTMRMVGTSAHGAFKYLTQAEMDALSSHPDLADWSYDIVVGLADNQQLQKLHTEIRYNEDKNAAWGFCLPTTGSMPRERLELATSTLVLDALGVAPELGATVPLEFAVGDQHYTQDFILSGWWEGDSISMAQHIFLSRQYVDEVAPLYDVSYTQRSAQGNIDIMRTLNMNVWFKSGSNVEQKLNKVLLESGLNPTEMATGVNWAYVASGELDITTLLMVTVVLLLIFGAGYLIIYNVFFISVAKDTRYYGLLKTIGTTGRQLRRIVRGQALLLSAVGIPIGLLLGWGLGALLYPLIASMTSLADSRATINPWVFVGAAIFALATVWVSAGKPCKLASRISPIEALRTSETTAVRGKKPVLRRRGRVSPWRMGWQNLRRGRKKVISVVASLSLSIILFNTVFTIVQGFDMDKFLQNRVISDLSVSTVLMESRFELDYLTAEEEAALATLHGITVAEPVYMQESQHDLPAAARQQMAAYFATVPDMASHIKETVLGQINNPAQRLPGHIYGIDRVVFEAMQFYGGEKPSWEQFQSGNYVITSAFGEEEMEHSNYQPGDMVPLTGADGVTRDYQVLALSDVPYPAGCKHGHIIETSYMLPTEAFAALCPDAQPIRLLLQAAPDQLAALEAAPDQLAALEAAVAAYCDSRSLIYSSRSTNAAEFAQTQQMYLVVGGTLAAILGLVGVLNFVNSMATSILARRRELAMLQSVGMTTRQLTAMLTSEGLCYAGLTAGVTLTAGNLLCSALAQTLAGQIWFFSYRFTMLPMLCALPLMAVLAYLIPLVSYRAACRESVVERLREAAE